MPALIVHRYDATTRGIHLDGAVWTFMGFSPIYQSITGLVELSGGLLLFHPRTRLLGAAIALVACVQVFLTQHVPRTVTSIHFPPARMAVLLMLPDTRRLLNLFLT